MLTPAPVIRRRVSAMIALHVGVATVLMLLGLDRAWGDTTMAELLGFTAAFGLVGFLPMRLELQRHACTVVLTEAVLVVALFTMGPLGIALSATAGEFIGCATYRQRPQKLLFNVTATLAASTAASFAFLLLATEGPVARQPWLPAMVAVACYGLVSLASTSAVLAIAEDRDLERVLAAAAPTALVSSAIAGCLGLALLLLYRTSTTAPLLLLPLVVTVVIHTRRWASQRAERLRTDRLYAASARTSRLGVLDESLTCLAEEARGLATGVAGLCGAIGSDGTWTGVLVDDHGPRPLSSPLLDVLRGLAAVPTEVAWARVAEGLRLDLPAATTLTVAATPPDSPAVVVLAVLRETGTDDQSARRAEALAFFTGHAALVVANARLYEDVESALRHQVDLNRQKSEFVAAVSHELRTPLTAALGAVQTVRRLDGRLQPAARAQLLEIAANQGERLRRLIEDLLLVAAAEHRSMRCRPVSVDVDAFLQSVVTSFSETVAGRLLVTSEVDRLVTDEDKLHRILTNLVENAVKYAPDGLIELTVCRPTEDTVSFAVADRGPGIPQTDRDRIFERFVQLDQSSTRAHGGTGLGLYLSRQLAELLGGTLTTTGRPGGGTVFSLDLQTGTEESLQTGTEDSLQTGTGEVDHGGNVVGEHAPGAPARMESVTTSPR